MYHVTSISLGARLHFNNNNNNSILTLIMSSLSLHDCLSLGEIELGLSSERRNDNEDDAKRKSIQEIQRLPLYLRILSLTRPLASISILGGDGDDGNEEETLATETNKKNRNNKKREDDLINRTVERLEHVVATYSVAEGVDVVTSYLAPNMSRRISQLPPLKRTSDGIWDTSELAAVARNPRNWKRKRSDADGTNGEDEKVDTIHESSSDDDEDKEEAAKEHSTKRRRKYVDRRDSEVVATEDSQEATFVKTLSELASLVVEALAPMEMNNTMENSDNTEEQSKGKLSLTIDDSILNESGSSAGTGGAMEGSDLGSTVAAIMFNASVLQSRHVAVSTTQYNRMQECLGTG
jgi:hypothetical protein